MAVREMRKHASWYLRGMRGAARIKDQVNEQTTREGMARVLTGFVEQLEGRSAKKTDLPGISFVMEVGRRVTAAVLD